MAAAHSRQLSRLQIPPPLGQQQPFIYGDNAPMFSPSLPTAINVGAHGGFPMPNVPHPLQTPMQSNFFPRPGPNVPGRPAMHRPHPSVVQLAAAGILPPAGMPMTPLGQVGFPQPMLPPPFVPKSKRSQSISTGGPPKAVLGGPQRKAAPAPQPAAAAAAATPAAPPTKQKKIVVNLPKETIQEGEDKGKAAPWARKPLPASEVPPQPAIRPVELITVEAYPPDAWRHMVPATLDVFLPGKASWQAIKQKAIEEKLAKLGVERGSGSAPPVHAPHARAASISSPADPALLFFKLNKLQQSQNASANASLSTSPQPAFASSPSPGLGLPPRLQNRHGHSMSLASGPSFYNPAASFNPFGPSATLGSDQVLPRHSPIPAIRATSESAPLHAPQGRAPTNISALAPPAPLSRPESKPDFLRGFGLDVTEEEEEPAEEEPPVRHVEDEEQVQIAEDTVQPEETEADVSVDMTVDEEGGEAGLDDVDGGESTAAQSRIHSRHVSKLSAALSLRSVGRMDDTVVLVQNPDAIPESVDHAEAVEEVPEEDPIAEWTGSEDLRDTDDESIGEWSNPSDEERARQERLQRRILRRTKQQARDLEAPRRLPNFPQPPQTFVPSATSLNRPHNPDDDVISNPSDEEHHELRDHFMAFQPSHLSRAGSFGRPLPPLPHSRASSAHFSYHDPALAHSREGSDQFTPGGLHPRPPKNETLNPLAKPFVFGSAAVTVKAPVPPAPVPAPQPVAAPVAAPAPVTAPKATPSATNSPAHVRLPSLGKPLNVAAPEFKPGGFTFKAPSGVPQLTFPPAPAKPVSPRPLPEPPVDGPSTVRATQGREKRQKRESTTSFADDEDEEEVGNDTMASFKFPPTAPTITLDDVKPFRHSAPASPPAEAETIRDNNPINAFTFAGFSSNMAFGQDEAGAGKLVAREDDAQEIEADVPEDADPGSARELPFPPTAKPKRAPIPLDFKHPVSTNTVPAGLFKALVNGDDARTRTSVRSGLSSRDIFEHSARPSLDDLSVPTISRRKSRNRLFTDPGFREQSPDDSDGGFGAPRRSSLPPRGRADSFSGSEFEMEMTVTREDMQIYEQRLKTILDEKIGGLRRTLEEFKQAKAGKSISADMDSKITEVISLFRAQLQDSATRSLDETLDNARGDFDFEMLKDIIEQSHAEARNVIQQDLEKWVASSRGSSHEFKKFSEDLAERTVKAVLQATSQITMHLHTLEQSRPSISNERDAIVRDVVNALTPAFAAMRAEPVDYDGLTAQLSQAVKPHISQLIDLASDKRETAGLIVERLVPLLPSLHAQSPAIDTDALVGRLTVEMRKILGPLDAHEIKEQVSDLVVERLDSRLAVRDKALSPDVIAEKVNNSIKILLEPLQDIKSAVDAVKTIESSSPQVDLSGVRSEVSAALAGFPDQIASAVSTLELARTEFVAQKEQQSKDESSKEWILQIRDTLDQMAEDQGRLFSVNNDLADFCQDIVKHVDALPEAMVAATKVLQDAHADMLKHDTSQKDAEEIRRLMNNNSELQVQLAKARGAHGQVRVEKDALADRLQATEAERDELRSKLEAAESSAAQKSAAVTVAEAKNAELEAALAQALERIKSADVASQESQERVSGLEKKNVELITEKQQLQAKVDKLEMTSLIVDREKESWADELATLKRAHEQLSTQESNWDELRRATEQIQSLAALIGQGETEEVKELRRVRDDYKVLEGEHSALQKRIKEQDNKVANNERIALAARQNLANAQERAVEWERRAKDYEHDLRATRTKLEEAEQAQSQLEADYSLLKLQLDERDAHERLAKDRESKMRDQIAAMEAQLARAQADLDKASNAATAAKSGHSSTSSHLRPNGYVRQQYPSRPDSRASTVYGDHRATTPTAQPNGKYYNPSARASPSPQPSVWSSMHAPTARRGPIQTLSRASSNYRSQIPSPTPSNVSAAPTLGDDGWYS